jgi:flagellar biosynthesis/type III secretory pathway protein FliH
MILRGAVLSEQPLALETLLPERASADRTVAIAAAAAVTADRATAVAPLPPPLSLETVVAWLGRCDTASRVGLAAYLATDIESLRVEAHADGFEAGRAQGRQEARTHMEESVALLQAAVQAAQEALATESAQLSELCADIIVEALTKIAGPILSTREAAVGAVVQILKRVQDEGELMIKVSHADLPALQEMQETLRRAMGGRKFALAADDNVGLGGCVIGSQLGTFDGRVEVQLAGLLESIQIARTSREAHG